MYCDRTKINYDRTTLDKFITINTQTNADDGLGGSADTPLKFCDTWAQILPMTAKEARENMRLEANITHNIRIRYKTGITAKMTVTFGSRTFEITGVINPKEANKWIDMVCNERL
jgi:SPP1 family predicted phage head-tail adaptor